MSALPEAAAAFNGQAGEQFQNHLEEVRGFVRQKLARRYLEPYLLPEGVKALDFGGGTGADALWLAGLGYAVTLLDESSDYLDEVQTSLDRTPAEQKTLVMLQQGGIEQLQEPNIYDLILSHGVLMYSDNPAAQLKALNVALKPNGTLSLLTKGLSGALEQASREKNQKNLEQLQTAGSYKNHLGIQAYAYTSTRIAEMLKTAGFKVIEWNGVRTLSKTDQDKRKASETNEDELKAIVDAEYRAGKSERKEMSQMLHFIAQKV